jgi:hypothetical protein
MNWQGYGASVQGSGHVRLGLPCQDTPGWRLTASAVFGAVADGLRRVAIFRETRRDS